MKLKLSTVNISNLEQMYGQHIEMLNGTTWQIALNSCGCSGDCGSNWMKS